MDRIKLSIIVAVLSAVVVIIGACIPSSSTLEDTKWFLRSYGEQGNLISIIEETEITATFNSGKGEVSGSAGCNTFFAGYEVSGVDLSIFELAYTEMACMSPEGIMEQEQEYLSLLASAQSIDADDTTLTIICLGGQILYFTTVSR